MTLIDNCKHWWKLWSIRLNAIGLVIMGWVWFDPTALLGLYNMLPLSVQRALPDNVEALVGGTLFALAAISRLVVQPKLAKGDGNGAA